MTDNVKYAEGFGEFMDNVEYHIEIGKFIDNPEAISFDNATKNGQGIIDDVSGLFGKSEKEIGDLVYWNWIDEGGNKHYGERPPKSNETVIRVSTPEIDAIINQTIENYKSLVQITTGNVSNLSNEEIQKLIEISTDSATIGKNDDNQTHWYSVDENGNSVVEARRADW